MNKKDFLPYCTEVKKAFSLFLLLFLLSGTGSIAQNLIQNPGCELPLVGGNIPLWQEITGTSWTQRMAGPEPYEGTAYFFPGVAATAELAQDIDISDYACRIDAGEQLFAFEAYVRSFEQSPIDESNIHVSFYTASDSLLRRDIFGPYTNTAAWFRVDSLLPAPAEARKVRVLLRSIRRSGTNNDGYYDALSLIPSPSRICTPFPAFSSSDTAGCGGPLTVDFQDLSSNQPDSWEWQLPGATPAVSSEQHPSGIRYDAPGTYDVTLIACNSLGCDTLHALDFIILHAAPLPPPVHVRGDTLVTEGDYAFEWYNANEPSTVLATGPFYVYAGWGNYYVVATDSNGCSSRSRTIDLSSGEVAGRDDAVSLFPNPAAELLHIGLGNGADHTPVSVKLFSVAGQLLAESQHSGSVVSIDVRQLPAGFYLLGIHTGKQVLSRSFVKR